VASPYTPLKIATIVWLLIALFGMFVGLRMTRTPLLFPGLFLVFISFSSAARMSTRLIRIAALEKILLSDTQSDLHQQIRDSSLAQQVLTLLIAVAEVDGQADARERDLIRQFLLERFTDPDIHRQIRTWDHDPVPADQIGPLVHQLRLQLSSAECETIFYWCCLVALIDQRFDAREHDILQRIARHIGLPPLHARRLFHHAKIRILHSEGRAEGRFGQALHGQDPGLDRRGRALEILGLENDATKEEVRSRHRELVKKFHPDAHTHLGPVAATEATERFREVQEAYEILSA